MMDKETYKKELMRMYAWVRDDDTYNMKECCNFTGKRCNKCPIRQYCFVFKFVPNKVGMTRPYDAFEVIEAVEQWSKDHPPKKHKVSQLEYDILKSFKESNLYSKFYFMSSLVTKNLLKLGYFEGADERMKICDYLQNCEVVDNDD